MEEQGFGHVIFPIENLRSTLKDSVAKVAPYNEERLITSLQRNWDILTLRRNLQPYFLSLLSRYQECIEKGGI